MLVLRADGKWECFECGVIVPRQNGKGSVLEARSLAGLYLLGERLIMWSAHEYKTAMEGFRRVRALIDNTDELRRHVKRMVNTNGEESIELRNGSRLRFVARSKGSGRGFSGDVNLIDEAYALTDDQLAALLPTMSARPNPQLVLTSSPPLDGASGAPMFSMRDRGLAGAAGLLWVDYGLDLDPDTPSGEARMADPEEWRRANPAYGTLISEETVAREYAVMSPSAFARERLGVWPKRAGDSTVINLRRWAALGRPERAVGDPVVFALDVAPDRSYATVSACSADPETAGHILEIVDYRPGTDWVVGRLEELRERWNPLAFGMDLRGPAVSLLLDLEDAGFSKPDPDWVRRGDLALPTVQEGAAAVGRFMDAIAQGSISHRSQAPLDAAVAGAATRPLGDAYGWSRRAASVDISPLCAATVALWAYEVRAHLAGEDPLSGIF